MTVVAPLGFLVIGDSAEIDRLEKLASHRLGDIRSGDLYPIDQSRRDFMDKHRERVGLLTAAADSRPNANGSLLFVGLVDHRQQNFIPQDGFSVSPLAASAMSKWVSVDNRLARWNVKPSGMCWTITIGDS